MLLSYDEELLTQFEKMAKNGDFEKKTPEEPSVKKRNKNNGVFNLYSLPIVHKLTEEEKKRAEIVFKNYMRYYNKVIRVVQNHINHFKEGMTDEEWIVYKVRRGGVKIDHGSKEDCENSMIDLLSMLLNILKRQRGEESVDEIIEKGGLKYFIDKVERAFFAKYSLGLTRGFSDYVWGDIEDELYEHLCKIESYHKNVISLVRSSDEQVNAYLKDLWSQLK